MVPDARRRASSGPPERFPVRTVENLVNTPMEPTVRTPSPPSDDSGATSVEYAALLGLVLAVTYAAISLFGDEVHRLWSSNSEAIARAAVSPEATN